jgi:hypothetical protein
VAYKSVKVPVRVPFSVADERREGLKFCVLGGAIVAGRGGLDGRGISFMH